MVSREGSPSTAWLSRRLRPRQDRGWRLLPVVALALLAAGCSDSTGPPPPPPVQISFLPAADQLSLTLGQTELLKVSVTGASAADVAFRRGATVLSRELTFPYQRQQVGADTIGVTVAADGVNAAKTWLIWVDGGFGDRPPPVPALAVHEGAGPGALRVSWQNPPASLGPRPYARFVVGARFDGPLTESTWPTAQILEVVPYDGGVVGYARDYAGLPQGVEAQVAVRVIDAGDAISPLGDVRVKRIVGEYRISGVVLDPDGRPVPNVSVSVGGAPQERGVTNQQGQFTLPDPLQYALGFPDINRYVLQVKDDGNSGDVAAYYDVQSDTLSSRTVYPLAVTMIPALAPYGDPWGESLLGPACGDLYGGQFLTFFRALTHTQAPWYTLRKWDRYPVTIWIQPAFSDSGGFDLKPWAQRAVAAWNNRLGEDYYTEVADSASADVVVLFTSLAQPRLGETRIVQPPGNWYINEIVPIKMRILIEQQLRMPSLALGLAIHEMGHALCVGVHSDCSATDRPHIMVAGAQGVDVGDPEGAISDEEALVVRLIRLLPQYFDMRHYILD